MSNVPEGYTGWVKVTYTDPSNNPDVILVQDGMVEGEYVNSWLESDDWLTDLTPVYVLTLEEYKNVAEGWGT